MTREHVEQRPIKGAGAYWSVAVQPGRRALLRGCNVGLLEFVPAG